MSSTRQESHDVGLFEPPLIEQTIGRCFEAVVAKFPKNEALVSYQQGLRYTYEELNDEAEQLASALLELGLSQGDRVGIWSHNNAQWLITQLATAKVGIVLVNINPAYRSSELEYALNKVGCRALIAMPTFKTTNYLDLIREVAPEVSTSEFGGLSAKRVPELRWVIHLGAELVPGMARFEDLTKTGVLNDPRVRSAGEVLSPSDPINIQFTSGTTGFPKGATLTHRNILNNGFFIGECMKLTPEDRLCIPVPLYHCFGMVLGNLACLTHGAAIVYPNDGFDPLTVLQTVQDERCTGLHGVPTMFIAELDHPRFAEFDLSTLRTGIMAGLACPTEVMKRVVEQMNLREITIAYGMTETSPVSCQSSTDTPLDKRVSTVGQVQPHLEIKIVDPETGRRAPRRARRVLHQGLFGDARLLGRPRQNARSHRRRRLDAHRRPGHHGRRGLREHRRPHQGHGDPRRREHLPARDRRILVPPPAGAGRAGGGRARPEYGEELCAWIIAKPGTKPTEDDIRAFCKGQIAHYKVPRYIRFVTAAFR
jgi:fatty-acyl-CoA synthase